MKKKTLHDFNKMKSRGEKITWITAYDYPFAQAAEAAGIDMILVGDSGGMVQLGYETTNPVTMDEMITLSKAVRKGAPNTFIVGDMPQGSYEVSPEEAVRNALRFVKEAGCDAVKLEGGGRSCGAVNAINAAGILVIGHLGLTPQSTASFGGYRVQGKSVKSFLENLSDARLLEMDGACMILLEAMPEKPASYIAESCKIPILGIGAGKKVDGQLVIMHDLTGFYQSFRPWFAKCYIPEVLDNFKIYLNMRGDLKELGRKTRKDGIMKLVELAVKKYVAEVQDGLFPSIEYTYPIKKEIEDQITESYEKYKDAADSRAKWVLR